MDAKDCPKAIAKAEEFHKAVEHRYNAIGYERYRNEKAEYHPIVKYIFEKGGAIEPEIKHSST